MTNHYLSYLIRLGVVPHSIVLRGALSPQRASHFCLAANLRESLPDSAGIARVSKHAACTVIMIGARQLRTRRVAFAAGLYWLEV